MSHRLQAQELFSLTFSYKRKSAPCGGCRDNLAISKAWLLFGYSVHQLLCLIEWGLLVSEDNQKQQAESNQIHARYYIQSFRLLVHTQVYFVAHQPIHMQPSMHLTTSTLIWGVIAEVVVFTAGLEDYASPICRRLQYRFGEFEAVLYRPATVAAKEYPCVKVPYYLTMPVHQMLNCHVVCRLKSTCRLVRRDCDEIVSIVCSTSKPQCMRPHFYHLLSMYFSARFSGKGHQCWNSVLEWEADSHANTIRPVLIHL